MRNGKLNNADFGARMRGEGPMAEQIRQMFYGQLPAGGPEPGANAT